MSLLRFLGIGGDRDDATGDTRTVREIAAQLERLEPDTARFLAGFAYVLARVANADLQIDESESTEMRRIVCELAELLAKPYRPEELRLVLDRVLGADG